jgi:hypothetical protein
VAGQHGADRKLLGILMEDRERHLLRGIAAGMAILLASNLALVIVGFSARNRSPMSGISCSGLPLPESMGHD